MRSTIAALQREPSLAVPTAAPSANGGAIVSLLTPDLGRAYGTGYDRSSAVLSIYSAPTETIKTKQTDIKLLFETDQFILNNINEAESERVEPVYSFGTPLVYAARGFQPRVYVYQLQLLVNKLNNDSRSKFMWVVETYARASAALIGSKKSGRKNHCRLIYRDRWVEGVILTLDMTASANLSQTTSVTVTMFVYNEGVN